jgi:hypothetical protein
MLYKLTLPTGRDYIKFLQFGGVSLPLQRRGIMPEHCRGSSNLPLLHSTPLEGQGGYKPYEYFYALIRIKVSASKNYNTVPNFIVYQICCKFARFYHKEF